MINDRDVYVEPELALSLRLAGFDWKVTTYYLRQKNNDGDKVSYTNKFDLVENEHYCNNWNNDPLTMSDDGVYVMRVSAPTLEMAQRWLREIYNLHITIAYDQTKEPYPFKITALTPKTCSVFNDDDVIFIYFNGYELLNNDYSSYEYALQDSISAYVKYIIPAKAATERIKNAKKK